MVGGFIHPGNPVANMFFVLYPYNSLTQAQLLLHDLKTAQCTFSLSLYASADTLIDTKLLPRAAFTAQIIGTLFGAVLNYVLMNSIIDN
jgi:hypothetical protein